MAAVDPDPVQEHDPFSLADSEDEDSKKKDLKPEDSERLKKAIPDALVENSGNASKETLRPAATTETKDVEAVERVTR